MIERIRFQADANFSAVIVKGLLRRHPEIDFQSAAQATLPSKPDPEVLAIAAEQGRILVSHDVTTMPTHFADFLNSGRHSPGVILMPQLTPVQEAIEALYLVWAASSPSDWVDILDHLPWRT